jgi:predicted dehydrogenase
VRTYNLGFIACGARNRVYARNLRRQYGDQINIAALCDADLGAAEAMKNEFGHPATAVYSDFRELIKKHRSLDGLLIATPNHLHEEPAVMAFEHGMHTLLEKPLAHSPESCRRIAEAYDKSTSRVTMGFVLRYTPFYRTIITMVQAGKVGQVKTLRADEIAGPVLSSVFFRTWRGKKAYTGDLLLEKCCHDLDLINTILGANPVRVTAFGQRDHYLPVSGWGPRCRECTEKDRCAFSTVLWARTIDQDIENGQYEYVDFSNDKCVYNEDHDVMDRQSQLIEYDGGILVSFSVALGGPQHRRTIDITGTQGRLVGDFARNRIVFYSMGTETPEELHIEHEQSGHGGGDSVITRSFIESLENPHYVPDAKLKDALKSALLAFLCDDARDLSEVLPVTFTKDVEAIRD